MSDASASPPSAISKPLGEKLPWEEICRRYPDEYVALVDYDFPQMTHVTAGIVHAHHPDRDVILLKTYGIQNVAIRWTGKVGPFMPRTWFRVEG
jgi:hypothetical protein